MCLSRKNLNKDIQVYDGVLTTVDDKTGIVFKAEVSNNDSLLMSFQNWILCIYNGS